MTNTPYFDAYEMYRASQKNIKLIKEYITLKTGEKVISEVRIVNEHDLNYNNYDRV